MTSSFTRSLTIGSCAVALLAFTDAAQAQQWGSAGVYRIGGWLPWTGTGTGRLQFLPPCSSDGQTITLSLNTGTGGPLGTADPNWTVDPGGTAYSTSTVLAGTNTNIWLRNQPGPNGAKWIQPDPSGTPVKFTGNEIYVYQMKFATPVDPYLYDSITITGRFAADDGAVVELNGKPIANCYANFGTDCFRIGQTITTKPDWRSFMRTATFGSFVNTVTIKVNNSGGIYSGLYADLKVTVVCSKCTAPLPPVEPACSGIHCI